MTAFDHQAFMTGMAAVIRDHEWDRLAEFIRSDAVFEYPQSAERFIGLANIQAQFANYPGLEVGSTQVEEIIGGTTYAMTSTYHVITVEGSENRGTAIYRARYPDGSTWFVLNLYELRDGRIQHSRVYFAPQYEAPEWRAPYRG
jgi:hypothetical protein